MTTAVAAAVTAPTVPTPTAMATGKETKMATATIEQAKAALLAGEDVSGKANGKEAAQKRSVDTSSSVLGKEDHEDPAHKKQRIGESKRQPEFALKKPTNHEKLVQGDPEYYVHALQRCEWQFVQGLQQGEQKAEPVLTYVVKLTEKEAKAGKRAQHAMVKNPLHINLGKKGELHALPVGDWKTKNKKLQDTQNKEVPEKAKQRRGVRPYAWNQDEQDENGEDPHVAEFLQIFSKIEHQGRRVLVTNPAVIKPAEYKVYLKGFTPIGDTGKDTQGRDEVDYVIETMKELGHLCSPLYIPVYPETHPEKEKIGKPIPSLRQLQMVRKICTVIWDEQTPRKEIITTDDPVVKEAYDKLLIFRRDKDKKQLQLNPEPVFDSKGRQLRGKTSYVRQGDITSELLGFTFVKPPKSGWIIKPYIYSTHKFMNSRNATIEQRMESTLQAVGLEGGDDFSALDEEDTGAPSGVAAGDHSKHSKTPIPMSVDSLDAARGH